MFAIVKQPDYDQRAQAAELIAGSGIVAVWLDAVSSDEEA